MNILNIPKINKAISSYIGEKNTQETRENIKNDIRKILMTDLSDSCIVKCDEEINPPDVINNNCLIALVIEKDGYKEWQYKFEIWPE